MDTITIHNTIIEVMAAILDVSRDQIGDDASMDTIKAWDSLKHMKLVMTLEQEFGIEFDDQEVVDLLSLRLIELAVRAKVPA
ncbi:MAG: acyl carrier protein [Phaeospirillum sp.]|nr:acyl carrier protein [Phaeospirillum sp.]